MCMQQHSTALRATAPIAKQLQQCPCGAVSSEYGCLACGFALGDVHQCAGDAECAMLRGHANVLKLCSQRVHGAQRAQRLLAVFVAGGESAKESCGTGTADGGLAHGNKRDYRG